LPSLPCVYLYSLHPTRSLPSSLPSLPFSTPRDVSGMPIDGPFPLTFATFYTKDGTRPTVLSTAPSNGQTGVATEDPGNLEVYIDI